jgi:hypothetical protein
MAGEEPGRPPRRSIPISIASALAVGVDGLPAPVEGRPYPDDFTGMNFFRLSVCFEGGCGGFPSAAFIVMIIGIDFKSMAMDSLPSPSPAPALAAASSKGDLLVRSPRVNKGPRFCRLLLDDVPSSLIFINPYPLSPLRRPPWSINDQSKSKSQSRWSLSSRIHLSVVSPSAVRWLGTTLDGQTVQ